MKLLEGIKVVELGVYVAIPSASRLLADWGADVIKVEAPKGDANRGHGATIHLPATMDCNPYFAVCNGGKRLLSLDLKNPEGMEAMLRILSEADIFMSNIRYGGLTRLGLDYETLHKKFPKLIYCYVNGYGNEGEEKDRPGFDMTCFWSRSGILNALRDPGGRSRVPPPGIGDTVTANALVAGVLGALHYRSRTGEGLNVTSSLLANGIWCNASNIVSGQERTNGDGYEPFRTPYQYKEWRNPFYHIYECKDGKWFFLLGGGVTKFQATMEKMGLEECIEDPRFLTEADRQQNAGDLYDIMEEKFREKTAEEWKDIMISLDVSYEIMANNTEVSQDEQAWKNGCFSRMTCPNGLEYVVPNSPIRFSGLENAQTTHVGAPGCDTSAILAEYGYTPEQIKAMLDSGAAVGT